MENKFIHIKFSFKFREDMISQNTLKLGMKTLRFSYETKTKEHLINRKAYV